MVLDYQMSVIVNTSFDEAESGIIAALKEEGFGILTEIDVQSALKEKIGEDFRRYKILGACNPRFAHAGLQIIGQTRKYPLGYSFDRLTIPPWVSLYNLFVEGSFLRTPAR